MDVILAAENTMTAVTTAARTLATLAAIITTDPEDKFGGYHKPVVSPAIIFYLLFCLLLF